jgi:hypothetical protein
MNIKPNDTRHLEWWRRGELNRFDALILRKLFILRSAKSAKSSQKAEVRYAGAIQAPVVLFCRKVTSPSGEVTFARRSSEIQRRR